MVRVFGHYMHAAVIALALLEAAILAVAFYLGVFLRFPDPAQFGSEFGVFSIDAVAFVGVFWLSMYAFGLYQPDSLTDNRVMLLRLAVSFIVGFVVVATLQFTFQGLTVWRSMLGIALLTGMIGIAGLRVLWLPVLDSPTFRRRVLVLGTGDRAARIATLEQRPASRGFAIVGYVDSGDCDRQIAPGSIQGDTADLRRIAERIRPDEIVVAVQDRRKELPIDVLLDLKLGGIGVVDFQTFWERQTGRIDLDHVYPSWLIFSDGFGGNHLQQWMKRLFDVAVSLIFLAVTLPVLIVTALAIKLESRGPVLYRQERVGRHGRPFMLMKFRSMCEDAEKDGVPRWASAGDDRVTRIGSFIRRTRIDEIPQLFNVLRGDMSLVGPRPERPYFVEELAKQLPYYRERHRVKPGISGWAQINFPYGASVDDAKQKLQYDLYYIKNYSLFLDFIILLQTARVVLWPEQHRETPARR